MKNKTTHKFQHTKDGVNVPPLVGRKPLGSQANLGGHSKLEFVVCDFQECKQLSDHDLHVALVN